MEILVKQFAYKLEIQIIDSYSCGVKFEAKEV